MIKHGIHIKSFAKANGLTKKEFIQLAKENLWYCYTSLFGEENTTLLGKRYAFFNARKETLAGFKNPARTNGSKFSMHLGDIRCVELINGDEDSFLVIHEKINDDGEMNSSIIDCSNI